MKLSIHIVFLITFGVCADLSIAAAMPGMGEIKKITAEWQCRWCPDPPGKDQGYTSGSIEGGAGIVSNDSFRRGSYTGLDEKGVYAIGNAEANYKNSAGDGALHQLGLEASNLGLDSRRMTINGGRQGHYDVSLLYDELPRLQYDTARTPFNGNDNQILPGSWVYDTDTSGFISLNTTLHDADIFTKRKKFAVTANYRQSPALSYELAFQRETKKGSRTIGLAIGSNPGNTRSVILAAPVDYRTDHVTASVNYSGRRLGGSLDYEISNFRNKYKSLAWDNPFTMTPAVTRGQTSLMPDNTLHQISLTGNYKFSPYTIGTAVFSLGLARQDDTFLPFTSNSGITAASLPVNSLDGEIRIFGNNINVMHKVSPDTQLRVRYNQQEQENETQRASYTWVVADFANAATARSNIPYSFRKRQLEFSARHLVRKDNILTSAIQQERIDRTYQDTDKTDQTALWVKLKNTAYKTVSFSVKSGRENRHGNSWVPFNEITPPGNTLMRKYNLADRQRDNTHFQTTWVLSGKLTSGLAINYSSDKYDHSDVGLQESSQTDITVDASYVFSQAASLTASYSDTRIQSAQTGSQTASTPNWTADNDERIDTLLLGVQYTVIKNRLDFNLDYGYSDATGETVVSGSAPFPDFVSTRHTITLSGNYTLKKDLSVLAQLVYEKYDESDWHIDSVVPNTLSGTLTTGRLSPSYETGIVNLSIRRDF